MIKVAILQSNYIPWKGYFDLINSVDYFVIYDTAQYTKNDWRNRNKIYTKQGAQWLTIPVLAKGKTNQRINETKISDVKWGKKHWSSIKQNYSKAPYFKQYSSEFEAIYMNNSETSLSEINLQFIRLINKLLGIKTELRFSDEFDLREGKTEKLVGICKSLTADIYLSGPAAKDYLDESLFHNEGMTVEWMDYSGYREYKQLHEPFDHQVTVLDLIFNEGPNAINFMKSF